MSQSVDEAEGGTPTYATAPAHDTAPVHDTAPPQEPARLGPLQRFMGLIFSPGETFEDINRKPTWLVPLLIIIVGSVGFWLFFNWYADAAWQQGMRDAMRKQSEQSGSPMPPEDRVDAAIKVTKLFYVGGAVVLTPIVMLIISGVFALVLMLMQAQTTFKKILSVVTWSSCVTGIIQALIWLLTLVVRDEEGIRQIQPFNPATISATNLGVLFSPDESPVMSAIAGSIDIFSIWFLILLAIGFKSISGLRKMSTGKMGAVVFGMWIVFVLIKAGMAAMFSPSR